MFYFSKIKYSCFLSLILIVYSVSRCSALYIGAKGLGMGGAFSTLVSDGSAIYWNPAGLAKIKQPQILMDLFYTTGQFRGISDINYDYRYGSLSSIALVYPFNKFTFGLSYNSPIINILEIQNIPKSDYYHFKEKKNIILCSGVQISQKLFIGIAGLLNFNKWSHNTTGFTGPLYWKELGFNLSTVYRLTSKISIASLFYTTGIPFSIGGVEWNSQSAKERVDKMQHISLTIGSGFNVSKIFSTEIDMKYTSWRNNEYNLQLNLGMEYFLIENYIPIRLGYYNVSHPNPYMVPLAISNTGDNDHFITMGTGINLRKYTLDIAIESNCINKYSSRNELNLILSNLYKF